MRAFLFLKVKTCPTIDSCFKLAPMKQRLIFSLLIVCSLATAFFYYWNLQSKKATVAQREIYKSLDTLETDGAFNFSQETIGGSPFTFHNLKGHVILLNFWASWCAPCVIEYPSMVNLIASFGGKIKMVTVSLDESKEDVERFLKRFGAGSKDVIHIWDPTKEIAKKFGTEKLPETYIFNKELKLVRKVPNSEDWGRHEVKEYLKQLLKP